MLRSWPSLVMLLCVSPIILSFFAGLNDAVLLDLLYLLLRSVAFPSPCDAA